jgi:ribosomal protein S18 acetylase RimI-like enzyme
MPGTSQTSHLSCRFLDEGHFDLLHKKFVEAFSDYVRPFQLSDTQFRNHLTINAVDLNWSVGCFDGAELVGLSLNGFGEWEGRRTVYDAGTGVVPLYRRRGVSEAMFEMMLPVLAERGYEQVLLEVVTINDPAVNLYKKLGFRVVRELLLMEASGPVRSKLNGSAAAVEICEIPAIDALGTSRFWDGRPSWQNTNDAIERSQKMKKTLGAFLGTELIGYIVYSAGVGRVAQMAVEPGSRNRGVGTRLLQAMRADTPEKHDPQVINVDASLTSAVEFLENRGFRKVLSQYEMLLLL